MNKHFKQYSVLQAIIMIACSLLIFACKKDKEVVNVDLGYNYFPSKKGTYVIYQVDSFFYNDFTFTIDTFQFQIKEKITENFDDLSKRSTQRIERFYRQNSSQDWLIKDVWFANRTSNTAEKVEENIRFVKIVFPLKKDLSWDGNRFNNLGEQNYSLTKINEAFKLGSLSFDSTIYISQAADSNLIEKKLAYEIYAKNVGLVFKKNLNITDKNSVINYTLPLELRANSGFDLTYKVIGFGIE
jgi:hypothetical protein